MLVPDYLDLIDMKSILVFKTSVKRKADVKKLTLVLNDLMLDSGTWNFDLGDRDKILRVETGLVKSGDIESALEEKGYRCVELED